MRINAFTIVITIAALLASASCKDSGDVAVKGVSLSETAITLPMGTTKELTAKIVPKKAANQNVIWESADKGIATVNNGVVKGIKDGTTIVTVTTLDGFFSAECQVTVATVKPEKMVFHSDYTIEVGQTKSYYLTWVPENADMAYSVSALYNDGIIELDEENRLIKGLKAGTTQIKVRTFDNSLEKNIGIRVVEKAIYPTDFMIQMDHDYQAGTSVRLNAWSSTMKWEPEDANYREFNIKSDDESIISVEYEGANIYILSFLKAGKTNLVFTVNPPSGKSILRMGEFYVHAGAPKLSIDKSDKDYWYGSSLILIPGGSTYTLNFLYENLYHNDFAVTNADVFAKYVKLDGKKVTATQVGSTNMSFRAKDNYSYTTSAGVRVMEKPTNLAVSNDNSLIELKKGASANIGLYTYPRNGTVGRFDIKTTGYVTAEITSSLFRTWSSFSSFDNTRTLVIKAGNYVGTGTVTITNKDNPSLAHTFNIKIIN